MTSHLIVGDAVWRMLTATTKQATTPVMVAVAYFGKGADALLPLPPGSKLVVNAGEAAVKAG